MNTLLDPITIGLVGGYNVGKTTLLKRFSGTHDYKAPSPTNGINIVTMSWQLRNSLDVKLKIIDFGAEIMDYPLSSQYVEHLIRNLNAVFYVLDITNEESVEDMEKWYAFLHSINDSITIECLLVHKAETEHITNMKYDVQDLDRIKKLFQFYDWHYTVGYESLGDVDFARQPVLPVWKQKAPVELLHQVSVLLLQQRQDRYYTLLKIPMVLEYRGWMKYSLEELEQLPLPF